MRILILLLCEPVHEAWEMVLNLLPVEDSIYHMAAEKSHFYLVPGVGVYLLVLMNYLKNV
jgi:hypothetical protein